MKTRHLDPPAFVTRWLLLLGCWMFVAGSAFAQTNALGWHTIAGGGGQTTNGGLPFAAPSASRQSVA